MNACYRSRRWFYLSPILLFVITMSHWLNYLLLTCSRGRCVNTSKIMKKEIFRIYRWLFHICAIAWQSISLRLYFKIRKKIFLNLWHGTTFKVGSILFKNVALNLRNEKSNQINTPATMEIVDDLLERIWYDMIRFVWIKQRRIFFKAWEIWTKQRPPDLIWRDFFALLLICFWTSWFSCCSSRADREETTPFKCMATVAKQSR